jgi:VCBS repeat-containing protein
MHKKLLSIVALTILVTSILAGCSEAPSDSSTLTILSITEGTVLVMKAGTDDWTEATVEMTLGIGDTIKTGDDSGAEITFFDGSTIELEAGTQIEITSLDSSPDTGTKSITLMQTIGTTISRVTKLLDPASTYAIETPSGVAAVRGSTMIVRIVFDDPDYEDGTVLIMNLEGHIYWIGNGEELQLAEGTQVIADSETAQLVELSLAVDDSATTDEDTPVTVAAPGVLGNDSGLIFGDNLAVITVDTTGTAGNVTAWGADGSFTYDPNGQFESLEAGNSTTDSFTYTVTDDYGITDTATVTITINGVSDEPPYTPPAYYPPPYYPPLNHPPVAVDDTATTSQNTSVTIDVLHNDHDPDLDTMTVISVGPAGNGTITQNGNAVTYTPDTGFAGADSFTYTISDGKGGTATATVTINVSVTHINNPPQAQNDSATTPQGTPVTINILANDFDPDGDMLTLDSVGSAGNGSISINGSNVIYTPNPGFAGTDSFDYTISDGKGDTDTAIVTITVTVIETIATLNIQIDTNAHAPIYIWDDTTDEWVVDGNYVTPKTIEVAGGHSYCVWLGGDITYYVKHITPTGSGWEITPDGKTACGYAAANTGYNIHFTSNPPS